MRKPIAIAGALFFFSVSLVASTQTQPSPARIFRSAEVVTASGVEIPHNSVANGIVELYLTIGVAGNVEDVRVARPLASVTDQSVRAVKSWTFEPATMRGKPIESRLTVVIVFCPLYGSPAGEIALPALTAESQKQPSNSDVPSTSPEIVSAKFPAEGGGRVFDGPAILRVLVGEDGQPGLVRVVYGNPSLVNEARLAIKDWRFSPAQVNGKAVISGIVLAFQFRSTITNQ